MGKSMRIFAAATALSLAATACANDREGGYPKSLDQVDYSAIPSVDEALEKQANAHDDMGESCVRAIEAVGDVDIDEAVEAVLADEGQPCGDRRLEVNHWLVVYRTHAVEVEFARDLEE